MARTVLHPKRNVWRIEHSNRAAVLIDGAAFFRAVRQAFLKARRRIVVVGWDIDSRTRLVGETDPGDGFPESLSDFLSELVRRQPGLRIDLLLWDYSVLYAGERELFPRLSLQWQTPEQVTLCLDDMVPFGCSQHQKIIVVDDAVAFSGGLDLTIRRWDTPEHRVDQEGRVDPHGEPYPPFHDVQMMVDGAAARALAEIAEQRWRNAMRQELEPAAPSGGGDCWPEDVTPDFTDVDIGISRTQPRCAGQREVREVETLFLDSIDAAQRSIYIENQFVTAPAIARRLARRLRQVRDLEVVMIAPHRHESWIEWRSMRNGRIRFLRTLQRAAPGRVRLLYPSVQNGGASAATMIHSKVMVVDDRLLRVGSANMNNRSMGADTECDLTVEARNEAERRAVLSVRHRLIADHCGVTPEEVGRAVAHSGSLIAAVEMLRGDGHKLVPIDDGEPDMNKLAVTLEELADPARPLGFGALWRKLCNRLPVEFPALAIGAAVLAIIVLTSLWQTTSLVEPQTVREALRGIAGSAWAPVAVVGLFVLGGLVAFPVLVLITATAAAFGPLLGFAYALIGVMASALVTYGIGARFGQAALRRVIGPRLDRIRQRIVHRGVFAVAAIRLVPVAPFTIVNLVAGASAVRLADYVAGTLLGMLPGLIALSALGHQIVRIASNPTPVEAGLLALAVAGWIAVILAAQALIGKFHRRSP
jgi:phospholipase D1/2